MLLFYNCLLFIYYICKTETTAGNISQPDLFGQSLIGDIMDAPAPVPTEMSAINSNSEPDLFADATFVSAPPHVEEGSSSQVEVDTFSPQFLKVL